VDITQHAARMLWQQSEALRRGIELRHPFLDRRLFEFLLAVPAVQKIQRGRSKALLRLAVPDAVPRRPSAADVRAPLSPRALRERERANWEACFARSRAADAGYIDADSLHKAFRRYLDGDISLKYPLARTFRLEAWLQRLLDADRTETARVPLTSAYH
jgi:asparagine synthase (glutamine-hydrolysing)